MDTLTYTILSIIGIAVLLSPIVGIIAMFVLIKRRTDSIKKDIANNKNVAPPQNNQQRHEQQFPYFLVNKVLTNREHTFYNSLKPITDKYGLLLFTKMRIADLVYIPAGRRDYMRWFNYIRAKHIDFIICNTNLEIKMLIELDDYTHQRADRIRRDEFVDKIFNPFHVKLLHVYSWNDEELEKIIVQNVGLQTVSALAEENKT